MRGSKLSVIPLVTEETSSGRGKRFDAVPIDALKDYRALTNRDLAEEQGAHPNKGNSTQRVIVSLG